MLSISEPDPPKSVRGGALFALGFRPFYLLGAGYGALCVAWWVAMLSGWLPVPRHLPVLLWHQHEMVFGFALAVVAGFLLTASRAWTGLATAQGVWLALLALHWIVARVAVAFAAPVVAGVVSVLFPLVLAGAVGSVLVRARNARNYFVLVFLALFAAIDASFFAGIAGWLDVDPGTPLRGALYLVIMLVAVMAGRVVPAFTANALPGCRVIRRPALDRVALVVTACALLADLASAPGWLVATVCFVAAAAHVYRQAGWSPLATRSMPILWVLHVAHAWLPVGLACIAFGTTGVLPGALGAHALGIGALGGMIIAMITRTALGHTGRPLVAGWPERCAYVLVPVAALLRISAAIAPATAYVPLVNASALAWIAAFGIYVLAYAPRLARARIDGRPG